MTESILQSVPPATRPLVAAPPTDVGNAERLIARHGADLRYVYPWSDWLVFDGRRWAKDRTGELTRRMVETLRALHADAVEIDDKKTRDQVVAHVRKSEHEPRVRASIAIAQSLVGVAALPEQLDAEPWLLNVQNGTIHLEVGEIVDHDRARLLTKLSPVEFAHDAEAPRWLAFLDEIFAGDASRIAFVQRAVGYSLTGVIREHALFILHGTGRNGKTTFIETLKALFGDYARQAATETFLERRSGGIPNDVAMLAGARFVAAVETREGRRLDETLVKRLTGGDTETARFLRQEFFEFKATFKPWLATNHKPDVRGTDEAIWSRIKLIPFDVTIPPNEQDPDLQDKLRTELPGILNWAVDGCLTWQREGLGTAAAIDTATSDYRTEMDTLGRFIDDCCVTRPDVEGRAAVLYNRYGYWCDEQGERDRLTQTAFGRQLRERGYTKRRRGDGIIWDGINLRHDGAEE